MHRLRLGVAYDFRVPADAPFSQSEHYADVLEQVRLVDQLGFDLVWMSEHHFVPDGYLPSFQPVAGAMAAVTERVRISTDVALAPFHHPLRLAEDLAVLDNLSNGRMELGLGMGYAVHEFDAFGIPRPNRVSLTEESLAILQQAWSDAPVRFAGKRFEVAGVDVFPKPVQEDGIPLWLAAQSTPGAERAARMATHLLPQGSRSAVLDPWRDAVVEHGRDPGDHRVGINRCWLITDDPERDWPPIKSGEVYRAKMYRDWNRQAGDNPGAWDADDKIPQTWVIGDADHVTSELADYCLEYGITDLVSWTAPPGMRPSARDENLVRFAEDVAPRLRQRVDGARGVTA